MSNHGKRSMSAYKRCKRHLKQYSRILIVCEGEETEPRYFRTLRRSKRLSTTTVEIKGKECGSHPRNVVEYALQLIKTEIRSEEYYDEVWCVFDDDDGRDGVKDAIALANRHKIRVAFSNPCFEIWYLLHYKFSTASCSSLVARNKLERYIDNYTKSKDVYDLLYPQQKQAIDNALRLREYHDNLNNGELGNPSTTVYELVTSLLNLSERSQSI